MSFIVVLRASCLQCLQEVRPEESRFQCYLGLHRVFEANLSYMRHCLNDNTNGCFSLYIHVKKIVLSEVYNELPCLIS